MVESMKLHSRNNEEKWHIFLINSEEINSILKDEAELI
jgi:hypothetical protein